METLSAEKKYFIKKRFAVFKWVPFVRLGVLSGSCAAGLARDDSDIDAIVGVVENRLYLGRCFTLVLCDILKIRNKIGRPPKNKLCLSLFVPLSSLKINIAKDSCGNTSYPNLVPVYGEPSACAAFLKANNSAVRRFPGFRSLSLYLGGGKKLPVRLVERLLRGKLGDMLEKKVRAVQSARISAYAALLAKDGREMKVVVSADRIETRFRAS